MNVNQQSNLQHLSRLLEKPPAELTSIFEGLIESELPLLEAARDCHQRVVEALESHVVSSTLATEAVRLSISANQAFLSQIHARPARPAKAARGAKRGAKDPVEAADPAAAVEESPIVLWNQRIAEKINSGMRKELAFSILMKEAPELHKTYLVAYNASHAK